MTRHRFRPRYRGIAWTSVGIGGSLAAVAAGLGFVALPLVTGVIGVAIGAAYLASPTWKLTVTADDLGLEVGSPGRRRFQLAWGDIVRVIAAPPAHACFVDGGAPERSLLVPGQGAPAPYDLEDRQVLYDAILAHVPAERVTIVESLEKARELVRRPDAQAGEASAEAPKDPAAPPPPPQDPPKQP